MQKVTNAGLTKGLFAVLLLLAGTYAPAFATAGLLKLRPAEGVPAIIVISLGMALLFIGFLSHKSGGFDEFGFRLCSHRYLALAIALGAPTGWALTVIINRVSSGSAQPEFAFRPWVQVGYFVIGAAIQEEIIFRGLLQTALARRFTASLSLLGHSLSWPGIIVAFVFGLVHLTLNPITAIAACVLGLLAGELKERSGSLVPAIVVHSLFNLFSIVL